MKIEQKNIGSEKALQKIRQFCSYQERTHQEVKDKLYGYGLYKKDVELLLTQMIEENYLNEERYAIAFAGGKFRMKKWGRIKIKFELKQKRVSEYCIREALESIDEEDYRKTIKGLFQQKNQLLSREKNVFVKKQKIRSFLLQRGFEPSLIMEQFKDTPDTGC